MSICIVTTNKLDKNGKGSSNGKRVVYAMDKDMSGYMKHGYTIDNECKYRFVRGCQDITGLSDSNVYNVAYKLAMSLKIDLSVKFIDDNNSMATLEVIKGSDSLFIDNLKSMNILDAVKCSM